MASARTHSGVTFVVLATAALAFSLLQSLIIPAIPQLEHTLHTSEDSASWLLTAYLLSAAIATPILGRLGDTTGKKKMMVIVLIALSVGTLVSALATSLMIMLVGRVIQGAAGAVFPLAFGIIRDEFPPERVAGAIGVLSAILGLGVGGGILLAGPILEHLSYHWLFWLPLLMALGATVATFIFVPESPVRTGGHINWLGALLMSGWLVTGLLAVSYGPTWGWHSPTVLLLFASTAVLLGLWIFSESRSRSPLVDMRMMRIPAVWSTNLAALLFGFGMFAMFITVPQFAQTPSAAGYGFGASVTQSGLYLLPFASAMVADRAPDGPALEADRVQGGADRGRTVLGGVLPVADPHAQRAVDDLRRGRAPGRGGGAGLRVHGQPDHRGGPGGTDGRGHRDEHQHPQHRRGAGERRRHEPGHRGDAPERLSQGGGLRAGVRGQRYCDADRGRGRVR